jgi:hypothetical protein
MALTDYGFWRAWRAGRDQRRAADIVAVGLHAEPSATDVDWLAGLMLRRDEDHARWELRYARRALGLLVAEREALNDRTAVLVAEALEAALAADPHVAADRQDVAQAQFNARLAAYRTALAKRDGKEPAPARLARELLSFAGAITSDHAAAIARGGAILDAYQDEASALLRRAFGEATLPEDLPPSQATS